MTKVFIITDAVRKSPVAKIEARNRKSALCKFSRSLLSNGMREIRNRENGWELSTSYGAYYTVQEDGKNVYDSHRH